MLFNSVMLSKAEKIVVAALISTSAVAWISSIRQPDMMMAMTTYDPLAISLFTASWTAGMAAMMFPAITPMVLLYNRFVTIKEEGRGGQSSIIVPSTEERQRQNSLPSLRSSLKVMLFIGSYLLVWAVTGIGLLLGWSVIMNNTIMVPGNTHQHLLPSIYGALLIMAGAYQFTPLKRICIGYCESPLSFFMRRWRDGTSGAMRMGLWHGMYCLGCCWAYFLLMVALGWMNLLWMGLFAGIIFGEKMWRKGGIWVARTAGIGLIVAGTLVISGMLPSLVSIARPSSSMSEDTGGHSINMSDAYNIRSNDGAGNQTTISDNSNDDTSMMTMQNSDNLSAHK